MVNLNFYRFLPVDLRKDYIAWLEKHATFAPPADGQPGARRVAAARFLMNLVSIPIMLIYGVLVPFWTRACCGRTACRGS